MSQRLAFDGVEETLPALEFGCDERSDGICPCRLWVGGEFPDRGNTRDHLRSDGLGIQLGQERFIQVTGVAQQGHDLARRRVL